MKTAFAIVQVLLVVAVSPLITGMIAKLKNNLRMKKGPGVLQPYYNLYKLFGKEEILPENSSWIFRAAPFAALGSSVYAACIMLPLALSGYQGCFGDYFVLIFVLAFGRFFTALAGLDTGSAFGGMGASREMFISSLAEPAALLALFAVSLEAGSTAPAAATAMHFSPVIAGIALFIIMIAETSRIPVDNRETHLELTMIHEAMVLEYTGKNLALIELASHVKQMVFLTMVANIALPTAGFAAGGVAAAAFFALKIAALSGIVAVMEVSTAKIRLFRVVDLLAMAFVISSLAVIVSVMGM
jgi:formate hydrogenlyase subunit 4